MFGCILALRSIVSVLSCLLLVVHVVDCNCNTKIILIVCSWRTAFILNVQGGSKTVSCCTVSTAYFLWATL